MRGNSTSNFGLAIDKTLTLYLVIMG